MQPAAKAQRTELTKDVKTRRISSQLSYLLYEYVSAEGASNEGQKVHSTASDKYRWAYILKPKDDIEQTTATTTLTYIVIQFWRQNQGIWNMIIPKRLKIAVCAVNIEKNMVRKEIDWASIKMSSLYGFEMHRGPRMLQHGSMPSGSSGSFSSTQQQQPMVFVLFWSEMCFVVLSYLNSGYINGVGSHARWV